MDKLKRRDFMKLAGMAVFCPKGLMAGHKPIKAHRLTLWSKPIISADGSTIEISNVSSKESIYFEEETTQYIDTKGYDYMVVNFNNYSHKINLKDRKRFIRISL